MLKRGIIGLIAVVVAILAGSMAVTMAQKTAPGHRAPRQPVDEPLPLPGERRVDAAEAVAGDDPMAAVDSFLDRNRKEADDSIKALSREAEALRARLQKVEAALARWQTVSAALSQGLAPTANGPASTPGPPIRWKQRPQAPDLPPPLPREEPAVPPGIALPEPGPDGPPPLSEVPLPGPVAPPGVPGEGPPPSEPTSLPPPGPSSIPIPK
jgi:hypothetical protein